MEFEVTKNEFPLLRSRLARMRQEILPVGERWAQEAADDLALTYRAYVATQGRSGSESPPLSPATEFIYSQYGEPDGSGILNHIETGANASSKGAIAWVAVPKGKPTIVAIVQDKGATISVTPKMRGFLATRGIFLRANTMAIVVPGRGSWSNSIHSAVRKAKAAFHRDFSRVMTREK